MIVAQINPAVKWMFKKTANMVVILKNVLIRIVLINPVLMNLILAALEKAAAQRFQN